MNTDGIANHSPPSGIQGVEVINRIFGKYDSIDHVVIMAYFWPDYNSLFYEKRRIYGRCIPINPPSDSFLPNPLSNPALPAQKTVSLPTPNFTVQVV
jgi:hypothetical protein